MKEILKSLKLNAANLLSSSDLINIRGGNPLPDCETCFNCVWTAVGQNGQGGACMQSCESNTSQCWIDCARNMTNQCYANFSTQTVGCYC